MRQLSSTAACCSVESEEKRRQPRGPGAGKKRVPCSTRKKRSRIRSRIRGGTSVSQWSVYPARSTSSPEGEGSPPAGNVALPAALRMASENPAKLLGMNGG